MSQPTSAALSGAQLLELANSDPERCLQAGAAYLEEVDEGAPDERAITLRALSTAAKLLGRTETSITHADRAIEAAGDNEQRVLARLARASALTVAGRLSEALETVEGSAHLADSPYLRARCSYQRAAVLSRIGEAAAAIDALEEAAPAFRRAGDEVMLGNTLKGLGLFRLEIGDLKQAERDLTEALQIATERDEQPNISGIRHNLGMLASYRGDIPEALEHLTVSDEIYMGVTGSSAPQHVARCEVLLSAGLFEEARRLADRVVDARLAEEDLEHLDDARIVAARAALAAGDPAQAASLGSDAFDSLLRQDKLTKAWRARATVVQARYEAEGPSPELLREAREAAERLDPEQPVAAASAYLLVGKIARDLGRPDVAVAALDRVATVRQGPAELRIQARLARALVRLLEDDTRATAAAVRSGLELIDDYQAALGSTDLRMGIERHGAELAAIGMSLALRSGRPRRVLAWMERTRARALRHRPVTGVDYPELHETAAELRRVEAKLRDAAQRADPALITRRLQLQDRMAALTRTRRGVSRAAGSFHVEELLEHLGERTLVELGHHDGGVIGVIARQGRTRQVELGPSDAVSSEASHVRFAMRRSARRGRPFDEESVARLDSAIFGSLSRLGEEVVLVPPPDMMAIPWSALPSLRGRNLSVSPSAEMWVRAKTSRARRDARTVVAGGPDLDVAEHEITAVAGLYSAPAVFGVDAPVEEIRSGLAGARTAHIVCHARFNWENPMFSSLRLADGDLNVYDIERLDAPPELVVLSACDSGYSEGQAGMQLAGLTSALLSMGARTVVASVGLVPDSPATSDLMVEFHRGLVAGRAPAEALARAQESAFEDPERFISAASFVCVGA